ncbi:hypothetical protein GA0061091_12710 [Gordonia sp. v-85]|nr:hypothetical protein GA0061091_12710 [Gordonia sp. v-85]
MEAVSISCDTLISTAGRTLARDEVEKFRDLAIRAARADFALPDPTTGRKEFSISKSDAELAVQAAREFSPSTEVADFLPRSTQTAIADIALFQIRNSDV